jgi:hypothetical protein
MNNSGVSLFVYHVFIADKTGRLTVLRRILNFLTQLFGLGFSLSIVVSIVLVFVPTSPIPNPKNGQMVLRSERAEDHTNYFYVTVLHAKVMRLNSILLLSSLAGVLTCSLVNWTLRDSDPQNARE